MKATVKKMLTTAAMVVCGTIGVQASAQASVFNFTYTNNSSYATDTASGTLTTGARDQSGNFGPNGFEITAITGTYNGAAITGLLPTGTYYKTSGFFGSPGNDNILFYPSTQVFNGQPTYLDYYGLGFSTTGPSFVNIYFGLGGYGTLYSDSASDATLGSLGTFAVTPASTAVPEPAVLGMFGLGLLLIGGFVGTRRRVA